MRDERNAVADRLDRRKKQSKPSDLPVHCCIIVTLSSVPPEDSAFVVNHLLWGIYLISN